MLATPARVARKGRWPAAAGTGRALAPTFSGNIRVAGQGGYRNRAPRPSRYDLEMDELNPEERERIRRRDRKRITKMIVDGGNLRRQVQALRERALRHKPAAPRADGPGADPRVARSSRTDTGATGGRRG